MYSSTGALIAKYTYDVWGNVLSETNATGGAISDTHVAKMQSFRYRSYYFDKESNFYYLQSRYYDPVTHRFINADGLVSTGTGILGYNMFAYCENNPVNKVDYDGLKAGDLFNTIDEAARDFAMCYNEVSIKENVEYATSIYQVRVFTIKKVPKTRRLLWWTWEGTKIEITSKIMYTYKKVNKGDHDGVMIPNVPFLRKCVAMAHTHAAYDPSYDNDNFSDYYNDKGQRVGDIGIAIESRVPIFVATPLGTLLRYDPSTDSTEEICNDIPWDPNHPSR